MVSSLPSGSVVLNVIKSEWPYTMNYHMVTSLKSAPPGLRLGHGLSYEKSRIIFLNIGVKNQEWPL